MKTLGEMHLPPPLPSDEQAATLPPNAEFLKQLILTYHHERIFNTNDSQKWAWATGDQPIVQPKTKGVTIMVSDYRAARRFFATDRDRSNLCWCQHSKDSTCIAQVQSRKEGYWNRDRVWLTLRYVAAAIAEFKYPPEKNTLVFIIDQSSCHKAYAENTLTASRMNAWSVIYGQSYPKFGVY